GDAAVSGRPAARDRDQRAAGRKDDAALVSHLRVLDPRASGDLDPVRIHEGRAPGRPADRGQTARRGGGAARRGGIRGGPALGPARTIDRGESKLKGEAMGTYRRINVASGRSLEKL